MGAKILHVCDRCYKEAEGQHKSFTVPIGWCQLSGEYYRPTGVALKRVVTLLCPDCRLSLHD
jgi:hypothetical protein